MGLWCSYSCINNNIVTLRHKYSYRKPCGKRQAHDASPAAGLPPFNALVIGPSPLPRLMHLLPILTLASLRSLGPHQLIDSPFLPSIFIPKVTPSSSLTCFKSVSMLRLGVTKSPEVVSTLIAGQGVGRVGGVFK